MHKILTPEQVAWIGRTFTYHPDGYLLRDGAPATESIHKSGYRTVSLYNTELGLNMSRAYVHRVVWLLHTGEQPDLQIDHKDRNRANNRIENLEPKTQQANSRNNGSLKGSYSDYMGVYKGAGTKIKVALLVGSQLIHVGNYTTQYDAALARDHFILQNATLEAALQYNYNLIPKEQVPVLEESRREHITEVQGIGWHRIC